MRNGAPVRERQQSRVARARRVKSSCTPRALSVSFIDSRPDSWQLRSSRRPCRFLLFCICCRQPAPFLPCDQPALSRRQRQLAAARQTTSSCHTTFVVLFGLASAAHTSPAISLDSARLLPVSERLAQPDSPPPARTRAVPCPHSAIAMESNRSDALPAIHHYAAKLRSVQQLQMDLDPSDHSAFEARLDQTVRELRDRVQEQQRALEEVAFTLHPRLEF